MNKKAQIKFGETIGVILVVYIIIMTGMIWYNNINNKNLQEIRDNDLRERAFEKYYYLNNLDLIHISQRGYIDEEFDIIGLRTLENYSNTENGREHLRKQLGESTIIVKVYNYSTELNDTNYNELLVLYNNTPKEFDTVGNRLRKITSEDNFRTLIPIIDPTSEIKTKLGYLQITNYITK